NKLSQIQATPSNDALPGFIAPAVNNTDRTFSLYVHVPFCVTRCGYCDFNTYISSDFGAGASHDSYASTAIKELEFAADAMENAGVDAKPLHTVFFGSGRPTLFQASDIASIHEREQQLSGTESEAERTNEASPDS